MGETRTRFVGNLTIEPETGSDDKAGPATALPKNLKHQLAGVLFAMNSTLAAYLDKGIKEVIVQFPSVEAILTEYGIGCGPCNVGTCLLKDIVRIHNLPSDKEQEMLNKISEIISPE